MLNVFRRPDSIKDYFDSTSHSVLLLALLINKLTNLVRIVFPSKQANNPYCHAVAFTTQ